MDAYPTYLDMPATCSLGLLTRSWIFSDVLWCLFIAKITLYLELERRIYSNATTIKPVPFNMVSFSEQLVSLTAMSFVLMRCE